MAKIRFRSRLLHAGIACAGASVGLVRACWRGELPLWFATLVLAATCSLVNPVWKVVESLLPAGPSRLLELAMLTEWAACLWLTLGWTAVGFLRSLKANHDSGGSALIAIGSLLLMVPIGMNSWSSARKLSCFSGNLWRETLATRDPASWQSRAVITYDDATQTLWLRGALELGMADEFVAVLKDHPLTRTIGVVSPGGYVLEAQAIAAEIMARGLDTYAPERCASACVDLFAAGERRWTTSRSMFGLHRSGNECIPDNGPTKEDQRGADFLRQRGVAESFIQQALSTPHDSIWRPDTRTVLDSHLATGLR